MLVLYSSGLDTVHQGFPNFFVRGHVRY